MIRLAVLYSTPLVWQGDKGQPHPIDILDFATERDCLLSSLREAGRAAEVRFEAATASNLSRLVMLGYRTLHYSGHGHSNFLAFEDGRGAMHALDTETLRRLCRASGGNNVQFAFISACYSRKAGEAFVSAGVPHVVAVRLETSVYDSAAREFATQFYLAISAGMTVKQSFDMAYENVRAMPNLPDAAKEADKFLLLPEYGNHNVALFADAPMGSVNNMTEAQPPHNLPTIAEHFMGRNVEMQKVVSAVLDNRLITVIGAPGIGKTTLAVAAAHYLLERRVFHDGIFFVELRGAKSVEAVRFAIVQSLLKAHVLDLDIEARDDDELFATLRPLRCLLVLDNCEDPLHHEHAAFRKFLSRLLQSAPHDKALLTARQAVGAGLQGVTEILCPIRQLTSNAAKRLFIAHASAVHELTAVDDRSEHFDAILRLLRGHPQAIALASRQLETKTLARLRADLEKQPVDTLLVESVPPDQRDAATSLAISLGVSVIYIRERDPNAVRLFAMMGLLPAGALARDLYTIWGNGWHPLMDVLVRASLVERAELGDTEHFSTFPFFTAYAERLLTTDDRALFAIRVCEHFGSMSMSIYQAMRTEEATIAYALLALEEENLWACLDLKRPARPKHDDEEGSPTAYVATYLPQILLFADRARDGIRAAERGREACHAVGDVRGEANTHQGLGNLLVADDHPDAAFAEFRAALKIHIEIRGQLGVGADLGYMGRAASAADRHERAALLSEEALSIHRAIQDRLGQALDLNSQAEALSSIETQSTETKVATLAAWWQAREIFHAIQSPSAARLDAVFTQLEEEMGSEAYQAMITDLQAHAEERRHAAIGALREAMAEDYYMQEIIQTLRAIPAL